jgi:hypothetical protein
LGCYIDIATSRDLSAYGFDNVTSMTVDMCIRVCSSKSYKYAGVQYEAQCFCGNTDARKYQMALETECNGLCAGNKSQKCGNSQSGNSPSRNNIYYNACKLKLFLIPSKN